MSVRRGEDIERWRGERLVGNERHLLSRRVRGRLVKGARSSRGRFEHVPGSEQMSAIVHSAIDGMPNLVNSASEATLRRKAVVAAHNKRGHTVSELSDIREFDLRDIHKAKPRLG